MNRHDMACNTERRSRGAVLVVGIVRRAAPLIAGGND